MSVCSVGPRFGSAAVRIGACRKAEAVSPKANPPSGRTNPPRVTPKRRMPKSGSGEPEGQPAQQPFRNGRRKNQPAEGNLRIGACRKAEAMSPKGNPPNGNSEAVSPKANPPRAPPNRCVPKSESSEPEGQPPSGAPESKRQPRAAKTTQGERSPSAGRSRETRGRRSSADTPTNTIEKRDCDTLRPSEAS